MTKCRRGEVVLVEFAYAQGGGSKKRPALIISSEAYHKNRQEVILAAITSNTERAFVGDTSVEEWEDAGLLFPSIVTGIIRTIKFSMIFQSFGKLSPTDFRRVERNLRKAMDFV